MSSSKSSRIAKTFRGSPGKFLSNFTTCCGLSDCDTNDEKKEQERTQQQQQQQHEQQQQQQQHEQQQPKLRLEKPSEIFHYQLEKRTARRHRNTFVSLPNLMQKDGDEDILGCCYCIKSQQVIVYKSHSTDFLAGFVITGSQRLEANLNSAAWEPFYRSADNVARETPV